MPRPSSPCIPPPVPHAPALTCYTGYNGISWDIPGKQCVAIARNSTRNLKAFRHYIYCDWPTQMRRKHASGIVEGRCRSKREIEDRSDGL